MNSTDTEGDFAAVRKFAKRTRSEALNFNSEHLRPAASRYVAWVDLMGAGHTMSTSVQKSANSLARLHIAVERARQANNFGGRLLPINDGTFIIAERKREFMSVLGYTMILLAANFIAVPRPQDRFLLRGAIAYGPIHFGGDLVPGLRPKKLRENSEFIDRAMFGPALIQAYKSEPLAPPYGISVHESARAFCPEGDEPFRMTHWMWWAPNEEVDYPNKLPALTSLKDCLFADLRTHFAWLCSTSIYHGLEKSKIDRWRNECTEYFSLG